jgi:hypothetical protein
MTKSQRVLIVDEDYPEHLAKEVASAERCVAYFRGIPMMLRGLASLEKWTLPHVHIETWEDQDPNA